MTFKPLWCGMLVALILSSSCKQSEEKESITTYPVIKPKIITASLNRNYVAEISALENIEIRSRINGVLEQIYVDEGAVVQKGQVMFAIESHEMEQVVKKAQASLATLLADEKAAKIELHNARKLFEKNIISATELELTTAKLEAAEARVDEAKGELAQSELNLSFTKIRAPFTGRINRILLKKGSIVNHETLITTLSNDSEVYAYFNLSEPEYLKLIKEDGLNSPKTVGLQLADGSTYSERGLVETAESEVNRNTGNIALRARFKNHETLLKHGSSAKVLWNQKLHDALIIPQQSTFEVQNLIYVYVVDKEGVLKQRNIHIENQIPGYYVIDRGLSPNDALLFEGIQMVRNNDKINPKFIEFPDIKL